MRFAKLISTIKNTDNQLRANALRSVNQAMTIRNWLIGFYIIEYEQKGEDRAKYGTKYLEKLSTELGRKRLKGMSLTNLKRFKLFYRMYPQIGQALPDQFKKNLISISPSITDQLKDEQLKIHQSTTDESSEEPTQKNNKGIGLDSLSPEILLGNLTFTHIVELIKIKENIERLFYEIETIKGSWSVKELKRQMESMLYQRVALSKKKKSLIAKVHDKAELITPEEVIKQPYVFEFLGLKFFPGYTENKLQTALLNNLTEFMLELGEGFCFENRRKAIIIDGDRYEVDLVFYHRVLKCHILIDLKTRKFKHHDVGQMNFYLNYYKDKMKVEGDNDPVGLILQAGSRKASVKYATAGMDNKVFVSKYMVELPKEKELEDYLSEEIEKFKDEKGR